MTSVRKTSSWIFIAATSAVLAFAGCSKSSSNKGGGAKGASKAAQSAFGYLPRDAATVIGVSSSITKGMLKSMVNSQINDRMPAHFKAIKAKCGIDMLTDLKHVVTSMGADPKDKKTTFVVVTGNFDKTKINDCVNKSEADGKKLSAKDEGKLTAYSREGDDKVFYGWWPNNNTVVFSPAENYKAGVEALVSQKKSLADNKRLMALVSDVNTKADLWGVGDVKLPGGAEQPDGSLIELSAQQELHLHLRLRYPDKPGADKAEAHFQGMLKKFSKGMIGALVGPFLKQLKLSTNGRDTVINFRMDEALLKKAMGMIKQFGGMMGGGRRRR